MALEDLTPAVRVEGILDGADITPATRLEYFLSKAANEVPKPDGSSAAGKVLTVNADGDGYILSEVDPGLPDITGVSDAGKVVAVNAAGSAYELTTPSGGSDLPEYGVSDEGKLLTVVPDTDNSEEVTIVPAQSVTIVNAPVELTGVNKDDFINGFTFHLTVNNSEISGVVVGDGAGGTFSGVMCNVYIDVDGKMYFYASSGGFPPSPAAGTYTVSLSVDKVPAKIDWDYNALVVTYDSDGSGNYSCDKDFNEIYEAYFSGKNLIVKATFMPEFTFTIKSISVLKIVFDNIKADISGADITTIWAEIITHESDGTITYTESAGYFPSNN